MESLRRFKEYLNEIHLGFPILSILSAIGVSIIANFIFESRMFLGGFIGIAAGILIGMAIGGIACIRGRQTRNDYTKTVALITNTSVQNNFFQSFYHELYNQLAQAKYSVRLISINGDPPACLAQKLLQLNGCDAAVVVPTFVNINYLSDIMTSLNRKNIPTTWLEESTEQIASHKNVKCAYFNNAVAAKHILTCIERSGFSSVEHCLYLHVSHHESTPTVNRLINIRESCIPKHVTIKKISCDPGLAMFDGYTKVRAWLSECSEAKNASRLIILCMNDDIAVGVIKGLHGFTAGKNVLIVAFDKIKAQYIDIPENAGIIFACQNPAMLSRQVVACIEPALGVNNFETIPLPFDITTSIENKIPAST